MKNLTIKKISNYIILVLLINLIVGCATTQSISVQDRQAIHTVTVNPKVKMPDKVYYMGPGFGYFMMGGVIGGAIAAAGNVSKDTQLQNYVVANDIHMDQIMRAHLLQQLPDAGLKFVAQGPADAAMNIKIKVYGFSIPQGFSTAVVPILRVEVNMTRDNQVIWSSSYYVDPLFGKMPKYQPSDLLNDPKLIVQAWNLAAQKASEHIISTLKN
jgi:hypothetical protein